MKAKAKKREKKVKGNRIRKEKEIMKREKEIKENLMTLIKDQYMLKTLIIQQIPLPLKNIFRIVEILTGSQLYVIKLLAIHWDIAT